MPYRRYQILIDWHHLLLLLIWSVVVHDISAYAVTWYPSLYCNLIFQFILWHDIPAYCWDLIFQLIFWLDIPLYNITCNGLLPAMLDGQVIQWHTHKNTLKLSTISVITTYQSNILTKKLNFYSINRIGLQ